MNWTETNNYLKGTLCKLDELPDPVRVAAFDLDDTLIHTPRGKAAGSKVRLIDKSISSKIAELVKRDFIIVIFTNQASMSVGKSFDKVKWRKTVEDLVDVMVSEIKSKTYYVAIYAAKMYDLYRKPNTGMWRLMKTDLAEQFELDKVRISTKSFFCGDAAGRMRPSLIKTALQPKAKTGDFSDTDYKFALNLKIKFMVPEQFYDKARSSGADTTLTLSGLNPTQFLAQAKKSKAKPYVFKARKKEIVIMVGAQSSGKTTLVKEQIVPKGYVLISRDICKSVKTCLKQMEQAASKGKCIVIDNTNPDVQSRRPYIDIALEHGYKHLRAIVVKSDQALVKHLNNVRHLESGGTIPKINKIAYNIFYKNFIEPAEHEHFDLIEHAEIPFDLKKLDDPAFRLAFMLWSEA